MILSVLKRADELKRLMRKLHDSDDSVSKTQLTELHDQVKAMFVMVSAMTKGPIAVPRVTDMEVCTHDSRFVFTQRKNELANLVGDLPPFCVQPILYKYEEKKSIVCMFTLQNLPDLFSVSDRPLRVCVRISNEYPFTFLNNAIWLTKPLYHPNVCPRTNGISLENYDCATWSAPQSFLTVRTHNTSCGFDAVSFLSHARSCL